MLEQFERCLRVSVDNPVEQLLEGTSWVVFKSVLSEHRKVANFCKTSEEIKFKTKVSNR